MAGHLQYMIPLIYSWQGSLKITVIVNRIYMFIRMIFCSKIILSN